MPNSIDLPAQTKLWTEQDINLYNKLDFYLAKTQVDFFKKWQTFPDLLSKQKWSPNMGPIMKGVHKVPAPVLRSQFFPNTIESQAKKDIIEVREVSEQARLRYHRFESQLMRFSSSFQDFLTDAVSFTNEQLVQRIAEANDQFLRTYMFHAAPAVWICGKATELTPSVYCTAADMSEVKNTAARLSYIADCNKTLDLKQVSKLGTVMTEDLAVDFHEGKAGQAMNEGLKGKYCAVVNSEVWDNWSFDPYLLANRQLDLNIVTDRFRGNLWGRWTTKMERFPLRIAADGSIPVPEIVEENPAAYNFGDTVPNPAYVNAPFGVAWAMGAEGYKALEVGPPPTPFNKGEMGMGEFRAMDWNAKVKITKDILIKGLDENGNIVPDTNKYGEYLQLISESYFGIIAVRRRNVIPIVYLRQRVGANL